MLLLMLCACSCEWFTPSGKDRQVLLVYIAGNNNISSEGERDFETMRDSWLPETKNKEKIVLVYRDFAGEAPVLSRLSRSKKGVLEEDIIMEYPQGTNSASSATLADVLADAENAWPARNRGLILWSHGSGFLPEGYYDNPREKAPGASLRSFGYDEDTRSEMELVALRDALSSRHYQFLLFDCCLMANVELAYELRGVTDYILFSPTEILVDGFPYESMTEPLMTMSTESALKSVATSYMDHYRAQSGSYRSATVTVIRTEPLSSLAASCRPVFQNHQDQIMTIDRSQIQPYFRYDKHWYYDLDDFVGRLASDSEYASFASALDRTVVFADATEQFLGIDMIHCCGLSVYIPRPEYTVLNNFYKTLDWNRDTGLVQ